MAEPGDTRATGSRAAAALRLNLCGGRSAAGLKPAAAEAPDGWNGKLAAAMPTGPLSQPAQCRPIVLASRRIAPHGEEKQGRNCCGTGQQRSPDSGLQSSPVHVLTTCVLVTNRAFPHVAAPQDCQEPWGATSSSMR